MEVFAEYLAGIVDPEQRGRVEEVLQWVMKRFPDLTPRVAWSQPMFAHQGTFIIGFSVAKQHMAVAPERVTLDRFSEDITASGYDRTKELMRMPWKKPVDYSLLERIIEFNIEDKAGCPTFWRK